MTVKLIWVTPDGDQLLGDMARVSNPQNQGKDAGRLVKYLMDHKHWSPFEMVNACVEINTTRDIARQILRHRSFSFQEFSQRYAGVDKLDVPAEREVRLQDTENRQNSIPVQDQKLAGWWRDVQCGLRDHASEVYHQALEKGIAKEVARAVLPEGLTPTRMYMNGSLRSWIHYWGERCAPATQAEHRSISNLTRSVVLCHFPSVQAALNVE